MWQRFKPGKLQPIPGSQVDVLDSCTVAYWCQQVDLPTFVQVACKVVALHCSVQILLCDKITLKFAHLLIQQ